MTGSIRHMAIPDSAKRSLRIMFIAKHAKWQGGLHPEDGNHAVYHAEMRSILEGLGLDLVLEDSYQALFVRPRVDFVFPLLNRGGFLNSEMLLPLLCTRHGIPFLGASPILRGLSDDKHLAKRSAAAHGVPTAPWAIFRRGAPIDERACPGAERLVIKPNASSASWGVSDAFDWPGVRNAVVQLHAEGHDAIVEPFVEGSDVEVPVITIDGRPTILPMMLFQQADPSRLRTYGEKRDLVDRGHAYELVPFIDPDWQPRIAEMTARLVREFEPFDYGRFEFRLDLERGQVHFLEVNLNCNLWSKKVFGRSAALAGLTQSQLIESILCESLRRHRLLGQEGEARAA